VFLKSRSPGKIIQFQGGSPPDGSIYFPLGKISFQFAKSKKKIIRRNFTQGYELTNMNLLIEFKHGKRGLGKNEQDKLPAGCRIFCL
jgi:hypothetical protein